MSHAGGERMGGPHPGGLEKTPRDAAAGPDDNREAVEQVLDEVDEELEQEEPDRC